jgi:putative nucleotidyltransferase with HDIG domain
MINVSILTMAGARSLGIEGAPLRALGLAAMLHDIGKVRTPVEILTKPGVLTPDERVIMRRHATDGAAILRASRDMPRLAAIVAFEHHLRRDGLGYPEGVRREPINLATSLCAIADCYDAMRTDRVYQAAQPPERIAAMMLHRDGARFDPHLVRRLTDLLGVYPPSTLVRLTNGEIGVVVSDDSSATTVKVILTPEGVRVEGGQHRRVRTRAGGERDAESIGVASTLDPDVYGIDPLESL